MMITFLDADDIMVKLFNSSLVLFFGHVRSVLLLVSFFYRKDRKGRSKVSQRKVTLCVSLRSLRSLRLDSKVRYSAGRYS
jgi:hypothetical protein